MTTNIDIHRQTFMEEAQELLADLETSLLDLERTPDDLETIGRIFRALHTIKGSGSMFGFDDLARFTHEVETVYDRVREGKLLVTKGLIDVTLTSKDHIRALLALPTGESHGDRSETGELFRAVRSFLKDTPSAAGPSPVTATGANLSGREITYRIRFAPPRDIFLRGIDPYSIIEELQALGPCRVIAHTGDIPALTDIDPSECHTFWDIILTTSEPYSKIEAVFIFVADESKLTIDVIDESGIVHGNEYKKLGEILVERGTITAEELEAILPKQKRLGELLVESGLVTSHDVAASLAEQQHVKEVREKRAVSETTSTIRVPSERLDALVNLVGELVTAQARLGQIGASLADDRLQSVSEDIERLIWELRDNTMSIRMVPIGSTFTRFNRLVRDLSAELGKEIDLVTEGAETELDKTVIEKLGDPLIHLIRNSIDHGIGTPEERLAIGKPRKGTITLKARHSGAFVFISITDDGHGIDVEAVRAKAVERGLMRTDQKMHDTELFSLLFEPGFSTAKKVTNVSGRGVGMDVVRRNIDALKGTVDIESAEGLSTTVTIKLPLTLAIIEGFLVRVGGDFFVIPLSIVSECIELSAQDVEAAHGREYVNVRGSLVPYIKLKEVFCMGTPKMGTPLACSRDAESLRVPILGVPILDAAVPRQIEHIVVTEIDGTKVGLVADEIIGGHQTVVKNLGSFYKNVEGISGATILGDGTVALIVDVPKLYAVVRAREDLEQVG